MRKICLLLFAATVFRLPCFMPEASAEEKGKERPATLVLTYEEEQITKIVPLKTTGYATIDDVCRPLLSATGTMAYLKERNSVIIFDYRKNVEKIVGLIDQVDLPAVNIRIDVDFIGGSTGVKDRLSGKVSYKDYPAKNNQIIIRNGKIVKPDEITIGAVQGRETGTRNTSQFILTTSGHPAQLWVGKRILDPTWLRYRPLRPTTVITGPGGTVMVQEGNDEMVWRDIGSSLYVLPTYVGNGMIDVEVYPVVSYLVDEPDEKQHHNKKSNKNKSKHQTVKVEDVSTRLTLKSGQKVSMGGVISSNKSFYTNFFGPDFRSRDESNSILDMYITATVIDPAGNRIQGESPVKADDNSEREDPRKLFRR